MKKIKQNRKKQNKTYKNVKFLDLMETIYYRVTETDDEDKPDANHR